MPPKKQNTSKKSVEALKHADATRKNIPTAELQPIMAKQEQKPVKVAYSRNAVGLGAEKEARNRDLDPQLVWRGKDQQDWSDLVVNAPPLYIQEKVQPKVLIDDLRRRSEAKEKQEEITTDLFGDFNGFPKDADSTDFYKHDGKWQNRMILGDSLQVMASLAEREGLRGQVQCIYFDPPYGIKFNSNFQWSTTSRDVKDGNAEHITREPEQVKAFRDTWKDGIHSYLTYLRDRLTVARDLLTDSGSIFVQIGDENVHRVRAVMDEVFGDSNFVSQISVNKTSGLGSTYLAGTQDFILWYAKKRETTKFRRLYTDKMERAEVDSHYQEDEFGRLFTLSDLSGQNNNVPSCMYTFKFQGMEFPTPAGRQWKTTLQGITRIAYASRVQVSGRSVRYKRYADDSPALPLTDVWADIGGSVQSRNDPKVYVVQTGTSVVQRCVLMASDPGDLVLDPTCGSGTTAYVSELLGRRWVTIDTSRVALALARARIMGARYPFYLLADSSDGQQKEAEVSRTLPKAALTYGNIRQGFVYERIPQITLQSFSKNTEIEIIWKEFQQNLEPLRERLNKAAGKKWEEWEIPREIDAKWEDAAKKAHTEWWKLRIDRQKKIDASIAAKAEYEYLYDKPYEDKKKVRVAGPFTVESLSPHRMLGVDEEGELVDAPGTASKKRKHDLTAGTRSARDFTAIILEQLKTAGVQQAHKEDKVSFTALNPWPGEFVCAEGRYVDGKGEKRAGIFIGPEFGTVSRPDLVAAAREAADADFDVLIACAFNFDAHSSEFEKLGRIPVLKARMNADLHMAEDLKNTGKGNLFVIFGEPDIDILPAENGKIKVKVNGVDVFKPQTGEVVSDGPEGIACWFVDTDYNEESFFVRQAYFLGATNDPYKSLKTSLKAEINEEAWATLYSDTSRAFDKPASKRIAVKVINHLGDEVMKVFRV
jgi:adenine-specific DNA-methyltransferase